MLDLYNNIKKKRLELGMSQDELAKKTGYKDRTSISKIESGKVDLSQSKIKAFAMALDTTTSELLGSDIQEGRAGRDQALEKFLTSLAPYLEDPYNPDSPAITFSGSYVGFKVKSLNDDERKQVRQIFENLNKETGIVFIQGSTEEAPESSSV